MIIGAKMCSKCDRDATVMLNDRAFCTEHAFEAIQTTSGRVPLPRSVK